MKNEDILKENEGKKFDIVLMNPPFGEQGMSGVFGNEMDMMFTYKLSLIANKIISIMPEKIDSKLPYATKLFNTGNIKDIELLDANKVFGISPYGFNKVGIYNIDNNNKYNDIRIIINDKEEIINNNIEDRKEYCHKLNFGDDIYKIIQNTKDLYNNLLDKYKSMCHDKEGQYIYEENKPGLGGIKKTKQVKLERVKKYLKEGKYKYCLYKGSGNHDYDKVQEWDGENPDKVFNGQICWLTDKENIKNNIKYWMECPLFDLWRIYYFNKRKFAACYGYICIPALNFDKSENEFKNYVNSLYKFNKDEIKILKDNNIHNANKL